MSPNNEPATLVSEFGAITRDLATCLPHAFDEWIPRLHGEDRPDAIEFTYTPPESERRQTQEAPAEIQPPAGPPRSIPANAACTLCSDRTFPLRQFRRSGKLPVLVLSYSGPFRAGDSLRDRSADLLFGSPEEDDLYDRMLGALGIHREDFHYLQYPGCIFNPERSLPEDWNRRCGNCVKHLNETVTTNGVRLLLLFGLSAVFLLSEDKARDLAKSGKTLPIPLDAGAVPALVLRSPAAVLALERKRSGLLTKGKEDPDYVQALEEEKRVKQSMLDALKAAKQQFV